MIKIHKKYITVLSVAVLIAIALLVIQFGKGKDARAYYLTSVLCNYIENNNGKFPASEKSLEDQGYLKIVKYKDVDCNYYFRRELDDDWESFPEYSEYKFFYGTDANDIKIVDNALVDRKSGEHILLIDGPYKILQNRTYEYYSLVLYKAMIQKRKERR